MANLSRDANAISHLVGTIGYSLLELFDFVLPKHFGKTTCYLGVLLKECDLGQAISRDDLAFIPPIDQALWDYAMERFRDLEPVKKTSVFLTGRFTIFRMLDFLDRQE